MGVVGGSGDVRLLPRAANAVGRRWELRAGVCSRMEDGDGAGETGGVSSMSMRSSASCSVDGDAMDIAGFPFAPAVDFPALKHLVME
jgi:hypothetical protein